MSNTNVLQAIDIITDSKIQSLKFDKTIIATISEVINSATGEYRAKYEAGIFKVYAEDPSITYEKDQSVYIKIPEGDYSNKKFIEGVVRTSENPEKVIDLKKVPVFAPEKFELEVDERKNIWYNNSELINQYIEIYKNKGFGKLTATFKGKSDTYNDYGFKDVLQVAQMSGTPFTREDGAQESALFDIENSIHFEFFDDNNVFTCENAYVEFGEYIDFSVTPYYLVINTPKGYRGNVELQGVLYHEGKDITKEAIAYQWYKEDTGLVDVDAGAGWEKLKNENKNTLELKNTDGQTQYKLIAFYEEGKKVSQIITINPTTGYVSVNENGEVTLVSPLEGNEIVEIAYYTPEGAVITSNNFTNAYAYLTIQVRDKYWNYYTTIWKQPTYSAKINFIGDDLYHYNANGDISAEIANIEHTIEPVYIEDKLVKSVKWYILNEEEPLKIGQYYNPEHSMMKNIWIDNNNVLHYMIKDTYAIQNWNNTFKIVVDCVYSETEVKNEIVSTLKEIYFVKDGQQGTNGTDYCCIVRPVSGKDRVTLLSESEAIMYPNVSLFLKAFVYYKGKLINKGDFIWSEKANCLQIIGNNNEQICQVKHIEDINKPQYHLITLKVNIDGNTIYYNYPICYATEKISRDSVIELNYPKYVQYTASGVSPEWLDKEIICKLNNNINNISIGTNDLELLTIKKDNKIVPSATFDFANGIGVIVINNSIYCPVMMYLNTFGNEAINDWDGTSIKIENGAVLAPQVGAGEKNTDGLFTGVVMGKDPQQNKIGLYGYQNGISSFGLMENGQGYFGKYEKNRIWFNGDSATIQGGGGGTNERGMTINLSSEKDVDNAILIGKGKFKVDYTGALTSTSGTIGGWEITGDALISPNEKTVLNSNGTITTEALKIKQGNTDLGDIGFLETNEDIDYLGISSKYGILLESKNNIRLSGLEGDVNTGTYIHAQYIEIGKGAGTEEIRLSADKNSYGQVKIYINGDTLEKYIRDCLPYNLSRDNHYHTVKADGTTGEAQYK